MYCVHRVFQKYTRRLWSRVWGWREPGKALDPICAMTRGHAAVGVCHTTVTPLRLVDPPLVLQTRLGPTSGSAYGSRGSFQRPASGHLRVPSYMLSVAQTAGSRSPAPTGDCMGVTYTACMCVHCVYSRIHARRGMQMRNTNLLVDGGVFGG